MSFGIVNHPEPRESGAIDGVILQTIPNGLHMRPREQQKF